MNFFIFVLGVILAIHGVIKVDGRVVFDYDSSDSENNNDLMQEEEEPQLAMLERDEIVSMAARALEYTEDDYLLKQIIPLLDNNIQRDFVRILTSLKKDDRDMVAIILSGLAWKTTKGCPRLSQAMVVERRIILKIMYPVARLLYNDHVLKKLSKSDQQVLKSAEQTVKTNAQLLCR
ncbi:unnamed protein product [Didymodactylos carnosus]|uniref:Uncharacterized protein n=1 Tax=Didymodactylos carnosus TaxID=1234261 RepID=A0A8S2IIX2_9BILA|nr:unnamed protein product [Didymodactylos carnosus]CAF3753464.1 unnamed protein product [Didymodactylos carnosus]